MEAVGVVDLAKKFDDDEFLAVDAQDEYLQTECTKIATAYAGGDDVIGAKKLTVYWDNLTEDSWTAGTRRVNCNLAALLPDRSGFAPVTGSVRGPVTGDTPAPPATGTPEPGVPAQVPPVEPASIPGTRPPSPCRVRHPRRRARTRRRSTVRRNRRPPTTTRPRPILRSRSSRSRRVPAPGPIPAPAPAPAPDLGSLVGGGY